MIYQLAKTSPLLTGQVKMNMIMNGNEVVDLQYTPISNYIPFAYNNPNDVLNYTHADNIKFLYNKISSDFFKDVTNPILTTKQLHRYDTLVDDTHENTYEMGMKRLEFQRYKKQFEFFCPFWCDTIDEMKRARFTINLVNKNGRVMYSSRIGFTKKIDEYIKNILPKLGVNQYNKELVYINFNEMSSYIKGLNVQKGVVQTVDTSYLVNNLLERERPVLETDNMILSLFPSNKIVCTQLFNFNFVFDLYDFIPLNLLEDFVCERINVYIDMYLENVKDGEIVYDKIPVMDLYSNYENIPKYDIHNHVYDSEQNVLDYLKEYRCTSLIDKNKITQSTFHWVLQDKNDAIFNIYNGFAPFYNIKENNIDTIRYSTSITNDSPDLFTDTFDYNKNPFGIFKFTKIDSDEISLLEFLHEIRNDDNYFTYRLDNLGEKEYGYLGNILLSNKNIKTYIEKSKNAIEDANKKTNIDESLREKSDYIVFAKKTDSGKYSIECYNDEKKSSNVKSSLDYPDTPYCVLKGNNPAETVNLYEIKSIKCGIFKINDLYDYQKIRGTFDNDYLLTKLGYLDDSGKFVESNNNYIMVRYNQNTNELYFGFLIKYSIEDLLKTDNVGNDDILAIKNNVSFHNLFNTDYNRFCPNKYSVNLYKGKMYYTLSQQGICYNALNFIAKVIKCTRFPNHIVFNKSFSTQKAESPVITSSELEMVKADKTVEIYRYDSNIYPMFVDENSIFKNNVYWCKQYNKTIYNTLQEIISGKKDLDHINDYANIALYKYLPLFKSIEYFVLNSKPVDYNYYYLYDIQVIKAEDTEEQKEKIVIHNNYDYKKEISWYKNNSFIYLPESFTEEYITETENQVDIVEAIFNRIKNNTELSDDDLRILIKHYIQNLYTYTYTYDYISETDITKQKYIIKFKLK
jgi:hypothetical protein